MKYLKKIFIKINLMPYKVQKIKNISVLIYKNGNKKIIF